MRRIISSLQFLTSVVLLALLAAMPSCGNAEDGTGREAALDRSSEDSPQIGEVVEDETVADDAGIQCPTIMQVPVTNAGQYAFGLGVDAPGAIMSLPRPSPPPSPSQPSDWDTLKMEWRSGNKWSLRTARTVWYVDSYLKHDMKQQQSFPVWLNTVLGAGPPLEPIVGVAVRREKNNQKISPVSYSGFQRGFRYLINCFPQVHYWGIVNEPDDDLTGNKEMDAVHYFMEADKILGDCQKKHQCKGVTLIAGEFAYQGGSPANSEHFWELYAKEMLKAVQQGKIRKFPNIWAFHPYADTSDGNTMGMGTWMFSNFLMNQEKIAKLKHGSLRAWLTETGTLLKVSNMCHFHIGSTCLDLNNQPEKQYQGAEIVSKLVDIPRVDRIYWWQYKQATTATMPKQRFDAAMVDACGNRRPAFCAITNQPLVNCLVSTCNNEQPYSAVGCGPTSSCPHMH